MCKMKHASLVASSHQCIHGDGRVSGSKKRGLKPSSTDNSRKLKLLLFVKIASYAFMPVFNPLLFSFDSQYGSAKQPHFIIIRTDLHCHFIKSHLVRKLAMVQNNNWFVVVSFRCYHVPLYRNSISMCLYSGVFFCVTEKCS